MPWPAQHTWRHVGTSSAGQSCPPPRKHPRLSCKPPPRCKGCGCITTSATPEGQPIHQYVAKSAPQNQPDAPAAEPDALRGQGEVQAKTSQFAIFAATQPRAQGCSCPKVALTAGAGTSGTSSQGTWGILEAERLGKGKHPPPHASASGELPARSLQRGNAEAPPAPQGPRAGSCPADTGMVTALKRCRIQPCIPTASGLLRY